jgi:hypothetical protein
MSYGLLSALSWGISTLLAAVAARRIGALRTLVLGETAGLSGYLTVFARPPGEPAPAGALPAASAGTLPSACLGS